MMKLMKNRKFMTKAVAITLLALVSTFQACGPGQLSKSQSTSSGGNALDSVTLGSNSGSYIAGPDGAMIPVEAMKTVGVNYSENVLASLVAVAGTGRPSQRTMQSYIREATKIPETGKADSVNAPMWMGITNLSGEVCQDLITAEKALAAAQRRIFGQVNFGAPPAQLSEAAKDDVIRRLARSAWARNETEAERSILKTAIAAAAFGTTNADTDRQMLFICTAILASLDTHDR